MLKLLLSRRSLLLLFPLFFFQNAGFAQHTVTSNNFLSWIGSSLTVELEQANSTTVNVGSAGANQVWDFTSNTISDPATAVFEFLIPGDTPFANDYPGANLVQRISDPSLPGFERLDFYQITPASFTDLGNVSTTTTPIDTSIKSFENNLLAPLPIDFNNSWMTVEMDTTGFFPVAATISNDTTMNTIDGWGTLRLPIGDFQCLRLRQDEKIINTTIVNGVPVATGTETSIQYDWISKDFSQLLTVQSQDGESNPNFTDARGFAWLVSFITTDVEDQEDITQIPATFELSQNYPNPFNPETVITYQITEKGPVELSIYNMQGRKVRILVNSVHAAGSHEIRWKGTDDFGRQVTSGLYIYRLKSDKLTHSRKMLLLQ